VILIDSRDQSARLKALLEEGRARLATSGETVKTQRIGNVEFLVLTVEPPDPPEADDEGEEGDAADDEAAEADAEEAVPAAAARRMPPQEFFLGQAGSLLVLGNSRLDLEKILTLRTGGAVMALAESTSFMPDFDSTLRGATLYAWINLETIVDAARQSLPGAEAGLPMGLSPARIVTALGFGGLRTLSVAASIRGDGTATEAKLRIPEMDRRGLFRILSFAAKESAPPTFVPADALSFSRTRIDLQKAWNTLEAMVLDIAPQLGGMLKLSIDAIGKDKDPGFDFRRQFVANLGDDIIGWQSAPPSGAAAVTPPELVLISSPKPDELAGALKLLMGMVPPDVATLEETEVAGKTVRSMSMPMGLPLPDQPAPPMQTIAFAGANGYLAVATDLELLKQFLQSADAGSGNLLAKPGLRAAAEKVGGLGTGMFGFSNDRESARSVWNALTTPGGAASNPNALLLQQFLSASKMAGEEGGLAEWIDLSLLPPFEKVEKYFHYSVFAGTAGKEAFHLRYYAPKPPEL
jgi:hypothetical protein